ncbi:EpsD family peptidyl-prolyl cis-trans isomerase [Rhodoferax sp.]|uniref:EpsD family peptidyl-prolyl cis-trans isomerase n=1 Tax=Rhodoferax sp. TaxID=50421 RepID=UPI00271BFB69|nr:EpsD family peptidyl-prolyl cis-trans isomerase [Rhodoferax sp.]MDO9197558.1 EpsD family peptidyl-prolyl cis-trans isomerase [Rhodoferax sp.]
MTSSKSRLALSVLATTLALGLSACGKKDDEKVATQVAARVGSEEISVHQINQVLSRTNTAGATPQAVQTMSREVLEKLIDQQLAVEQATETKLNRSPEVVSQLEASRRDILARAYMQKIAAALSKPTPEEIKKYHVEHPQLFAERRIFNVQEILVPAAAGVTEQLRGFASAGKSMEEAAAWLKSKDIKFGGGSATRAAEQIPLELLAQIHTLKDGQSVVIQGPQAVTLLRVASSQLSPIPEAAALPRIEQFLTNQRASEAVAANIKQLRSAAKIDYMGEFAKAEASPTAAAPAVPTTAQAPATDGKATTALEKGVAGLK